MLRSLMSGTLNIHFSEEDPAWTQAILPVMNGALGIRNSAQLVPSSFVTSAAACSELVSQILPEHLRGSPTTPYQDGAMVLWSLDHDAPLPEGIGQENQTAWDSRRMTAIANKLLENAQNEKFSAWISAASTHESGVWLNQDWPKQYIRFQETKLS